MLKSLTLGLLLLTLFPAAHAASEAQTPRFLIHLLDYLAKDYGGAVADGKVLSKTEYKEQVEFSQSALKTNGILTETKNTPEIARKLTELNRLILAKKDAAQVSKLAREIQTQVISVAKFELAPLQWPSIKRGAQLFSQNCVSCHGASGAGDGPAGIALDPKPANFLDSHMREVSPFQAFNTIRLGVPGTGMIPFHTLSDREVWDLAFYVVSLRHKSAQGTTSGASFDQESLKQVAISSDEKLEALSKEKTLEQQSLLIGSLRTHSNDDESGGSSLLIAEGALDAAVAEYEKGDLDSAKTKALRAYLEGIEPIEPKLKATDPEAVTRLEEKMAAVRGAIEGKASLDSLKSQVASAKVEIKNAKTLLTEKEMSPWVSFMAALAIILREGFEAVLVVIALLGVIRAAGSRRAALWVHGGWTAALGVGLITWFFSGWLMGMSGAQRETLEGVTSIFAVLVLLIVGFWLHNQTEIGRWKAFIHGRVQNALEGKNLFALATISFVAVFREAFETVLFLRAIWFDGGEATKYAMVSGVVVSLSLVITFAWAILKYSAKLPVRRLFEASALMMAGLAVILTGKGVHALQETGAISVTTPPFAFRVDLLGLFPTWETVISQGAIVVVIAILWAYSKKTTAQSVPVKVAE